MLAPDDPRHGTNNGYVNHGCRCEPCHEANKAYQRSRNHLKNEWRWRTGRSKPLEEHLAEIEAAHGTESRYQRCDCPECRQAAADARRRRRHADIEAARAYDREYKRKRRAAAQ